MKKVFATILSILLVITSYAQININEINESLVKINDSLYASKYEISNKIYRSFINSLKQSNDCQQIAIAEVDTMKWTDILSYNEPYVHYYHSHPAYYNFPLVNISYEAANLFCQWLTQQYNSNSKRKFKKVLFKLPSENEWIQAAQAGNKNAIYPWKGNSLHNSKGQVMYNFKRQVRDTVWVNGKYVENMDVTAPIKSYWKNDFGLYNMGGNVSEMINEKGITKGGSWRDDSEFLKIKNKNTYDGKSQANVGFRYFVEILEK